MTAVLRITCAAPAADDLAVVQRRAELAALEADVSAIVGHPGAAPRAHGRILAWLTGGTASENAEALDEYTAAVQRCLMRRGG